VLFCFGWSGQKQRKGKKAQLREKFHDVEKAAENAAGGGVQGTAHTDMETNGRYSE
jgi:hypothetical protein